MEFLMIIVMLIALFTLGGWWLVAVRRSHFLVSFEFPSSIKKKIATQYPHLSNDDIELVLETLRCYFQLVAKAKYKALAMPSQVVDVAWHEFILFTKSYQLFCKKGFGRFIHHTPTEAMSSPTVAQESIKRVWRLACIQENINPKSPERLPALFAIDQQLKIKDGFFYQKDCKSNQRDNYCATHIGCASGCSGSSADNESSCSGGCGGGD
ncbi:hypothetical protein [Psychrobium sp. 1_MG-2023]|uniref:glycine-rich domain-containing protein n=1 Tax=Psychrobium sp. 1_MG-2023 TaxID=3062624 RepID=UPI000C339567|nr:hypothetical protein [Psychrobium sp. 1_MG-2023]MDP2560486.1 hypothetical protein [Psychrobium sp. 1_MG-2023]PKF57855.1 hypothetical protein CW748_04880 [Alteromonadales bacterium alter-6D02]